MSSKDLDSSIQRTLERGTRSISSINRRNILPIHRQQKAGAGKAIGLSPDKSIPTLAELEKAHIINAYRMNYKTKFEIARVLEFGINTLRHTLKAYEIN